MNRIVYSIIVCAIVGVGLGASSSTAHAMNKAELIEAMASNAGLSEEQTTHALNEFLGASTKALKKGDRLSMVGFGSLSDSKRSGVGNPEGVVAFFPDVRSTGAANRHQGDTVVAHELAAGVFDRCKEREHAECPSGEGFVDALLSTTMDALLRGEVVSWGEEFGTFSSAAATSISKRSARTGRNPQTGKEIQIAAKNTVKFKAGAELSKSVN